MRDKVRCKKVTSMFMIPHPTCTADVDGMLLLMRRVSNYVRTSLYAHVHTTNDALLMMQCFRTYL